MKHNLSQCLLTLILLTLPITAFCFPKNIEFQMLRTSTGLPNSQINDIFRDSHGYIWFATQSGLSRFDGFRFKMFYSDNMNKMSIPNNSVSSIQEDANARLWIRTVVGYCIYDPKTETFDINTSRYLSQFGIKGSPEQLMIDEHKNLWLSILGDRVYVVNVKNRRVHYLKFSKNTSHSSVIWLTSRGNTALVSYSNGLIIAVDTRTYKLLWKSVFPIQAGGKRNVNFKTFIDNAC